MAQAPKIVDRTVCAMAATPRLKTLYLNGVAIGQVPVTGDAWADVKAATEFLRSKGYRPPSRARFMMLHASSFAKTAEALCRDGALLDDNKPTDQFSITPFVVNATFAVELYLKTLAEIHGTRLKREHELLKLHDALPIAARTDVERAIIEIDAKATAVDFRGHIAQINKAYHEWRYSFEGESTGPFYIQPVIFVIRVLHSACRNALDAPEKDGAA